MKHVKKTVLLLYSAAEMYQLVVAVEDYPRFLPWCDKAERLATHADGVTARLGLSFAGVRQAFTTRNVQVSDEQVHMQLVDGPFSTLDGTWRFMALAPPGGGSGQQPVRQACKIEFDLRYAFSSRALEAVLSPVFDKVANTFVDSFVKRAEEVYGPR